jgi:ribosomal protein S18 acetylase RimI-like enzyme
MMSIDYREGFDAPEFLQLAQRVWPRDYALEAAKAALAQTINIGAWDDGVLVGSVRILTDGYFFATIPEILVAPEYQKRGIGQELMRRAVARSPRGRLAFGAQAQSVEFFERIGCERSLVGFVATAPLNPAANERAI